MILCKVAAWSQQGAGHGSQPTGRRLGPLGSQQSRVRCQTTLIFGGPTARHTSTLCGAMTAPAAVQQTPVSLELGNVPVCLTSLGFYFGLICLSVVCDGEKIAQLKTGAADTASQARKTQGHPLGQRCGSLPGLSRGVFSLDTASIGKGKGREGGFNLTSGKSILDQSGTFLLMFTGKGTTPEAVCT